MHLYLFLHLDDIFFLVICHRRVFTFHQYVFIPPPHTQTQITDVILSCCHTFSSGIHHSARGIHTTLSSQNNGAPQIKLKCSEISLGPQGAQLVWHFSQALYIKNRFSCIFSCAYLTTAKRMFCPQFAFNYFPLCTCPLIRIGFFFSFPDM